VNSKQITFISISFLLLLSIFTFLIPQTEQPDGLLSYHNYISEIESSEFNLRYLYYYIVYFFDQLYQFFRFDIFCKSYGFTDAESCFGAHQYSEQIKDNVKIFGFNLRVMDYNYMYPIFSFQLGLVSVNFFIFIIFITIIKYVIKLDESNTYLTLFYFFFPSVLSTYSYLSPNVLSVLFHLIFFLLIINSRYLFAFLFSIISIIFDLQNSILLFSIINFIFIINVIKFRKKILLILFYCSLTILFLFLFKNEFMYLIGDDNLAYLNIRTYEPLKSLTVMYLGLYYIGGSSSILSFEIEYLLFLLFILLFLYKNIINYTEERKQTLSFFIAVNLTFFQILIIFPTIDQGRYYFILLLCLAYFFIREYRLIVKNNFYFIFFIIYTLNIIKIMKHFIFLYS